jgi:hypothetical protein
MIIIEKTYRKKSKELKDLPYQEKTDLLVKSWEEGDYENPIFPELGYAIYEIDGVMVIYYVEILCFISMVLLVTHLLVLI